MHLFASRPSAAVVTTAATVVFMLMFVTGCGDTFRPVANPIITPGGDPAGVGNAIILASNGAASGTSSHINVSGDSVTAVHDVGINPVQAILLGSEVIVANQGSDNLTAYPVTASGGTSVVTVSLPAGAKPTFVHSTDNTNVYVAETGANAVGVISLSTLSGDSQPCSVTNQAPCHISDGGVAINSPVAIAQPVGLGKVYVANAGSGKVTVIDVPTLTVKTTISVGANPLAIVASADNNCLYVANQGSNNVTVINTSNDTATAAPIAVGSGPMFLRFDNKLQRVYVVNKGGSTVSVIAHSADCNSTLLVSAIPVGPTPQSLTVLSDGTRAYTANSDGSVTVINASSNTVSKTITTSTPAAIVSIGSSTDGAKVFVANSSGHIFVIRTTDDTVTAQFPDPAHSVPLPGAPSPQYVLMF
jgi:YVTN family beta-propeller protein